MGHEIPFSFLRPSHFDSLRSFDDWRRNLQRSESVLYPDKSHFTLACQGYKKILAASGEESPVAILEFHYRGRTRSGMISSLLHFGYTFIWVHNPATCSHTSSVGLSQILPSSPPNKYLGTDQLQMILNFRHSALLHETTMLKLITMATGYCPSMI